MFEYNLFNDNDRNDDFVYIPPTLGFPKVKDVYANNMSVSRNNRVDIDYLMTRLIFPDRKNYIKGLPDEYIADSITSLICYRKNNSINDGYMRRVDEAIILLEEELEDRRNGRIIKAGKRAEKEIRFALKHLSADEYITIPIADSETLIIRSDKSAIQHEYDAVVVSRYGVVIVECKNYRGELIRCNNGMWIRKKNGKTEVLERNPIVQVDYQKRLMEEYLLENEIDVPVDAIICINNPSANISISGELKYPVVTLENLLDTIESIKNKYYDYKVISQEVMDNIVNVIRRNVSYDFD